jgi:hypothetical protein
MSWFDEETYHALCRNDATVREVWRPFPLTGASRPRNGGPPFSLATALEGNTHVQCLSLHFTAHHFAPTERSDPGEIQEEKRLRAWIQTSTSLRSVKFSFSCQGQVMGVWIDAVAANTNISSFRLMAYNMMGDIDPNLHPTVADALCRVLHTTQSIKDARIRLGDRIGNLSEALRSNSTLEFVSLTQCSAASLQPVIDALHGHGSIRRIELGLHGSKIVEVSPLLVMESLSTLLQSSSILTEISLHCFHFNEATMEQFINALDSNRSIATLFLGTFGFSNDAVQAMLIAYIQKRNGHCNDVCVPLLQADLGDGKYEDKYMLRSFSAQIVMGPHSQGLTMIFSHRDRDFATF